MQILALEIEKSELSLSENSDLLRKEAQKVWDLTQDQIIRKIWFRADESLAVILLECSSLEEAKQILAELPLVSEGLIDFELIPLIPYPGFARLFTS